MTFADFIFKYTNPSTGLFKDQINQEIEAEDQREFAEDIAELIQDNGAGVTDGNKTGVQVSGTGTVWLPSDHAFTTVSTTGSTITLAFSSKERGYFAGSATFAVNKAIAFSNDSRATQFDFIFEVTVADIELDFGPDTRSTAATFIAGVFTAMDVGLYKVHGTRYGPGGLWILDFRGVYSVGDAPPEPPDPGSSWILTTGIWNDSEYWDDDAIWKDGP